MQLYHPHPPIYINNSLSLSPPAPTILQKRLATPPTSPDTPPSVPATSTISKRLRSSKSFPLLNATNRGNTPVPEKKNSSDVFSSVVPSPGKTLRRKQSRGVLQDDNAERAPARRLSALGKSEHGLRSRSSFQKSAPHTSHRLRRQDNSAKSLRSEYQQTDPITTATVKQSLRYAGNEVGRFDAKKESDTGGEGKGFSDKGRKTEKRRSCEVLVIKNAGSAPIPRSKSDPLSASTHVSTLHSATSPTSPSKEGSDEETNKYNPKEVFSKERFLNRHSRDFGHLYARPTTSTTGIALEPMETTETTTTGGEDAIEDLVMPGAEVNIALVRKEGREKRRSWALYRAGLVSPVPSAEPSGWATTPHSAPAGCVSHSASISQNQQPRPGHHRRVSSFLTGAHHPSVMNASPGSSVASPQVATTVPRQTVMSGGFKPLALVAVTRGIASSPSAAGTIDRPIHRRTRWSMGSSVGSPSVETSAPINITALGNTRDEEEEELSIIVERESEKSRTSTSISLSSAEQSRASLSSIPAHLRNHSSSTTSSSLSSLGAIIHHGSSPSKSTSSCSSGGEHLGGPKVLSGDAFNFRMSIVSGGGRRRSGLLAEDINHEEQGLDQRSDSRMTSQTFTNSSSGFDSIRTDSRMTLRGKRLLPGQIDPEDALMGSDKDSRAARRRARAFLVAGLKLEEGSLYREQPEEHPLLPSAKADTGRRGGVVIEKAIEWNENPPLQVNTTTRKRYSIMRAEKTVPLQLSTSQARSPVTTTPATLGPSLLWRQHEFHSSETSSASSYHTAIDQPLNQSPVEESHSDVEEPGFMEVLDNGMQVPAERYRGRESVSPITLSSDAGTARMSPAEKAVEPTSAAMGQGAQGITIAIYDPAGHARQASLASIQRDSIVLDGRPVPLRNDSQGSSGDIHLGEQEMNSLELERQLFFDDHSANADAFRSVRKVKSDIGLGASQITLPHGRSMSRPTSPVIIHQDSAGASPGRQRKTGWSKGVREWWRDESKVNAENETERGFGLGRGGDEERIPVSAMPAEARLQKVENKINVVVPTPSRLLKEKRSWRPFLAALRGEKWRETEQTGNRNQAANEGPPAASMNAARWTGPALPRSENPREMSTMTLDPPFMEQSSAACSVESTPQLTTSPSTTNWLSPLPLPTSSMTETTAHFSPFSATTFSPQTPGYPTYSPGTSMRATGIQLNQEQQQLSEQHQRELAQQGSHKLLLDSQGILSPTPGISPNIPHHHSTMTVNRLVHSRQFASDNHLDIRKPEPIHLLSKGKSLTDLCSPALHTSRSVQSPVFDEHGRDVRGPLHGLGLHVGWADETIDRKGKARAESDADEQAWEHKIHRQASELFKLNSVAQGNNLHPLPPPVTLTSSLGRRPAVGILTNAGLLPTAGSSSMWHQSPSAVTVVEPLEPLAIANQYKDNVSTVHGPPEADDMTVAAQSVRRSSPSSTSFSKAQHREHRAESQAIINMHSRELQPAKLFFLLGFLLGPWVWLLGGWGLSPAGYFSTGPSGIPLGLSWQHAQATRFRQQAASTPFDRSASSKSPLLPPMSRDQPDKWVKRNRWAAVASAGVFIPAMCAGFAAMGTLL